MHEVYIANTVLSSVVRLLSRQFAGIVDALFNEREGYIIPILQNYWKHAQGMDIRTFLCGRFVSCIDLLPSHTLLASGAVHMCNGVFLALYSYFNIVLSKVHHLALHVSCWLEGHGEWVLCLPLLVVTGTGAACAGPVRAACPGSS